MKVKQFHLRISKEYGQQDEDTLNSFMQSVSVIRTNPQLVTVGQTNFWSILVFYDGKAKAEEQLTATTSFDLSSLNEVEKQRYETLRIWRVSVAAKDNYPNYIVASNAQLGAIAKLNPSTKEELYSLKGFGEKKAIKYGDDIIALLNSI